MKKLHHRFNPLSLLTLWVSLSLQLPKFPINLEIDQIYLRTPTFLPDMSLDPWNNVVDGVGGGILILKKKIKVINHLSYSLSLSLICNCITELANNAKEMGNILTILPLCFINKSAHTKVHLVLAYCHKTYREISVSFKKNTSTHIYVVCPGQ